MTDIVERLRAPRPDAHPSAGAADMAEIDNQRREAADVIESLRQLMQTYQKEREIVEAENRGLRKELDELRANR